MQLTMSAQNLDIVDATDHFIKKYKLAQFSQCEKVSDTSPITIKII